MDKRELRQYIRRLKAEHSPEELMAMSQRICRDVMNTTRWKEARVVLLYSALPDEVDTTPLLHSHDKTLLLPKVCGEELTLHRATQLSPGAYGIMEPTGEEFTDYDAIDLAIVPGMAFDDEGHRLGRGKGYYDRLLPKLKHTHTIGLCFPFQKLIFVPVEAYDVRLHEVRH